MESRGETNRSDTQVEAALDVLHGKISKREHSKAKLSRESALEQRQKARRNGTRRQIGSAKPEKLTAGRKIPGHVRPPLRTFWRWMKKYKESGGKPWALRDYHHKCGSRRRRLSEEAVELVTLFGNQYANGRKTYTVVYQSMQGEVKKLNQSRNPGEQIVCPSIKALKSYVRSLGKFHVYAGRNSIEAARKKFQIVSQGPDVVRPFERIEMDHWEVHLHSLLSSMDIWDRLSGETQARVGRMQLCAAFDHATKTIQGMKLSETATSADALDVLRMVVSDKRALAIAAGAATPWHGCATPELIVTDAGGAFIADDFREAILDLGAAHDVPPGGVPHLKGSIERFFRTIDLQFTPHFEGRSFENIVARGNYPGSELANLTAEDLAQAICIWVIDVYHNQPHDGLYGETPNKAFARLTQSFGTSPAPDGMKLRAIFGTKLKRVLGTRGMRVLGLHYWSPELVAHFFHEGEVELDVRLDPMDIGRISVRLDGAWHEAVCVHAGFDGLAAETWLRTLTDMRRVYRDDAEMTRDVVLSGLAKIRAVSDASLARAGIALKRTTDADINRAEQQILLGFTLPAPSTHAAETTRALDLLSGGTPVTGNGTVQIKRPERPSSTDPGIALGDDDFSFEG